MHFGDRWQWITELAGDIMTESDRRVRRANLTSGGRYYFGDDEQWAFNVGLRLDVADNDLDDTSPIGGLVGITYSSPTRRHLIPRDQPPPPPPPLLRRRRAPPAAAVAAARPRVRRRMRSRCARPAPATVR